MAICELKAIKIDMKIDSYVYDRKVKQNDTLIFNFTIFDDSIPADLTGYKCVLNVNKADVAYEIRDTEISITGNKVRIICPSSVAQIAGILSLELCFIDTVTSMQKTSFDICIEVRKSVLGNSDGTIPKVIMTELQHLDKSLEEARKINQNFDDDIDNADTLDKAFQSSIAEASTSKTALDASVTTATTTKGNLDESISTANETIDELKQTNSQYTEHVNNLSIHVTKTQKDNWDGHIDNADIHVTKTKTDVWDLAVINLAQVINILDKSSLGSGTLDDEIGDHLVDENEEEFIG